MAIQDRGLVLGGSPAYGFCLLLGTFDSESSIGALAQRLDLTRF
jgi:hypothetical protein